MDKPLVAGAAVAVAVPYGTPIHGAITEGPTSLGNFWCAASSNLKPTGYVPGCFAGSAFGEREPHLPFTRWLVARSVAQRPR